jgi:hypothetical protein
MERDPLDALLAAGEPGAPGPGFTARVLVAVRREAAALPPIPFPWRRLAAGVGLAGAAAAGMLLAVPAGAIGGPASGALLWTAVGGFVALAGWRLGARLIEA